MMTSSSGWPARKRGIWSARAAMACGALLLGSAVHEAGSSLPAPVPRHTPSLSLPRALPRPSKLRRPLSSLPQSIQPAHVYRIRWGDSLWSLAQRFHISIAALESANHLNGTTIYAGDILTIPTAHTVVPGESVESIARQHKVPVLTLWHANHLVSDNLAGGRHWSFRLPTPARRSLMPRPPQSMVPAQPRLPFLSLTRTSACWPTWFMRRPGTSHF